MTKEQAIALYKSGWWISRSARDLATFQLFENRLCMPFEDFHEAITTALGRPVYTHEFGLNREGLQAELMGTAPAPTLEEILELIPADKRIVVIT